MQTHRRELFFTEGTQNFIGTLAGALIGALNNIADALRDQTDFLREREQELTPAVGIPVGFQVPKKGDNDDGRSHYCIESETGAAPSV